MTEPLKGPPTVDDRQQLATKAYVHMFKDEWFDGLAALEELLRVDENISPHDRAIFLSSYGTCLMNVGRARDAALAYEEALALSENSGKRRFLKENIIFCRDQCDETTIAQAYERRRAYWHEEMAELAAKHAAPHPNDRDPERPLRVGYVGADFRSHSANMSYGFVLMNHTPAIEAFCYSSASPQQWDHYTTIYSQEKTLRVIDGLDDETIADKIVRRDKIDILVDLGSFSNGGRMRLFAMKPAPIQVTAWGYVLGTGMDTIDVIFGDPVAMPYSSQEYYRERIVHLPAIIPFCGQYQAPPVAVLPSLSGALPFTFGCFNRAAKIGDTTLRMWSKILKAAPATRIIIKEAQIIFPYHRERILKALDVDHNRVVFQGLSTHPEHLKHYDQIDLALDPFPIAGGVSMLEGLWQGVPAIVRDPGPGARVVSLVGLSALKLLGMDEFIAASEDDYVKLAVRWATEGKETLAQWRLQLRKMVFNSALTQGYTAAVEEAYRELWRAWCKTS